MCVFQHYLLHSVWWCWWHSFLFHENPIFPPQFSKHFFTSWTVKLVIVQDEELCDFVLWTKDWVKSLCLQHHKHTLWNHKKCGFQNPSSHCFTTLAGCCFAEKEACFPTSVGLKGALQEMMGKPSPTSYPSHCTKTLVLVVTSTWYREWLKSAQWDGDCKSISEDQNCFVSRGDNFKVPKTMKIMINCVGTLLKNCMNLVTFPAFFSYHKKEKKKIAISALSKSVNP